MYLLNLALAMIGILTATVHCAGHTRFNTTGYIEIAPDVYILNQTSNLSPEQTRPHNSTHCQESIYWDRYGMNNFNPLLKDCQYLLDNLIQGGSNNVTVESDWVLSGSPVLGAVVVAISGTCSFFAKVVSDTAHVWIGIDDIRHMLNVTITQYSGVDLDGVERVDWINGEVNCQSDGAQQIYWSVQDVTYGSAAN
ncbi:hypothetical protein B0T21DRAFT_441645 [Apiosordaria backusii]|uniref:Ecp2 effector protein-like domain-containing protein n=1 Tax=Apiosordaria backusii TaxID=314023 RepID=A0AA40BJE3_9PEZI|nr:hypothetical protein B0T21DRAFT_441645 [Apiosordaria backusii]